LLVKHKSGEEMGRVRRYKKIKAIDPFAKKGKVEIDTIHDEPPDMHKERGFLCNFFNGEVIISF
jgi:hypothetical protein